MMVYVHDDLCVLGGSRDQVPGGLEQLVVPNRRRSIYEFPSGGRFTCRGLAVAAINALLQRQTRSVGNVVGFDVVTSRLDQSVSDAIRAGCDNIFVRVPLVVVRRSASNARDWRRPVVEFRVQFPAIGIAYRSTVYESPYVVVAMGPALEVLVASRFDPPCNNVVTSRPDVQLVVTSFINGPDPRARPYLTAPLTES